MKIKNSPSSSSCNDISPPQSPLLDSTQLDQLSNNLRMMSIDDESINKVLEKLKTIEIQPFDYEAVVRPDWLLQFVMFRFKHLNLKMDQRKAIEMYEKNQKSITDTITQCNNGELNNLLLPDGALGRLIKQNSDLLEFIFRNNLQQDNQNGGQPGGAMRRGHHRAGRDQYVPVGGQIVAQLGGQPVAHVGGQIGAQLGGQPVAHVGGQIGAYLGQPGVDYFGWDNCWNQFIYR